MKASERGVIEIERRIQARPETVFAYFTDPQRYRRWQGVDAELDARPGGLFRITMTGRSATVVRGRFLEVDPPSRLVFTWGWEPTAASADVMAEIGPGQSVVEVVLVAEGDATILRLRHSGIPSEGAWNFHTWGWEMTLERLATVARGDDPGPSLFEAL